MKTDLTRLIFGKDPTNQAVPYIFIVLCIYTLVSSIYTLIFFNLVAMLIRFLFGIIVVTIFVVVERSKLSISLRAFLAPTLIVFVLIFGAIFFSGDSLIFVYLEAVAIISVTYFSAKGLAAHILVTTTTVLLLMVVFSVNLLGSEFSIVFSAISFLALVGIDVLYFVFCKYSAQMLQQLRATKIELEESVRLAKKASQAKSDFLRNMSHEIRTPLGTVIGMTVIGKRAKDVHQKDQSLDNIEKASNHLLGVINDILDMSRIESGKLELSPVEFDFDRMLKRVTSVVNFKVADKHQQLTINVDNNIPELLIGDDQRLSQVITNLVGNAVKFTPEYGSIHIGANLQNENNGICTIKIMVTDTGIGINLEQQEQLFQSFEQAEKDTQRKYGGTGLGLMISKNIVDLMGGDIWIESEPGRGSTFSFTVKLGRGKTELKDIPEGKESKREIGTDSDIISQPNTSLVFESDSIITPPLANASFEGHRILLAEDVLVNREIISAMLEPTNVSIDYATSGSEVVKMFKAAPASYDLILMDIEMPELDGLQATKEIRLLDLPRSKTIPIIALSANVFKEDIAACMEAGMSNHIGKPISLPVLMKVLEMYL